MLNTVGGMIIFAALIGAVVMLVAAFRDPRLRFLRRYFSFVGKSPRTEYWVTLLVSGVFFFVAYAVSSEFAAGFPHHRAEESFWFMMMLLSPPFIWLQLSVTARRLGDLGWSKWYSLTVLVPYVGLIPVIALGCMPSPKSEQSS
jgi:uncharacterized membrane protein YhaH (DUF805 family)